MLAYYHVHLIIEWIVFGMVIIPDHLTVVLFHNIFTCRIIENNIHYSRLISSDMVEHIAHNCSHCLWLITLFIAHCSLLMAHCSLHMAHGSWLMAHCSWLMAHCTWLMAHCSWLTAHGSWLIVHGSLLMAHGSLLMAHGSLYMAHGSWLMAHGSIHCSYQWVKLVAYINQWPIQSISRLATC